MVTFFFSLNKRQCELNAMDLFTKLFWLQTLPLIPLWHQGVLSLVSCFLCCCRLDISITVSLLLLKHPSLCSNIFDWR